MKQRKVEAWAVFFPGDRSPVIFLRDPGRFYSGLPVVRLSAPDPKLTKQLSEAMKVVRAAIRTERFRALALFNAPVYETKWLAACDAESKAVRRYNKEKTSK